MRWHLQHWIGASPVYQAQNEAGSWWHSDVPPPGGWHWGRYHNQRDAGGREKNLKEERLKILNGCLKPVCMTNFVFCPNLHELCELNFFSKDISGVEKFTQSFTALVFKVRAKGPKIVSRRASAK